MDSAGNIYVISGDGEFDPNAPRANFGDSIMKLPLNGSSGLAPSDYFSPFDQSEMDVENSDLGSSGPILLPDQLGPHSHLLYAAAKNGTIYLLNRDDMGHFQSTSNSQIVQNLPHFFAEQSARVRRLLAKRHRRMAVHQFDRRKTAGLSSHSRAIVHDAGIRNGDDFHLSGSDTRHLVAR